LPYRPANSSQVRNDHTVGVVDQTGHLLEGLPPKIHIDGEVRKIEVGRRTAGADSWRQGGGRPEGRLEGSRRPGVRGGAEDGLRWPRDYPPAVVTALIGALYRATYRPRGRPRRCVPARPWRPRWRRNRIHTRAASGVQDAMQQDKPGAEPPGQQDRYFVHRYSRSTRMLRSNIEMARGRIDARLDPANPEKSPTTPGWGATGHDRADSTVAVFFRTRSTV